MRWRTPVARCVAMVLVPLLPVWPVAASEAATGSPVMTAFLEDFDGPAGAGPNPRYWSIDVGPSAVHGWEKGSLQTYTDAPENVRLDGNGHLVITARRDGEGYTSGRVVTRGKLEFGQGTLLARIKFPSGQGLWPAFWMLGANIDTVGWPRCGEIDIMELINDSETYHVALHAPGADPEAAGPIADLSDDFHNYWVTRTPHSVTVGVDSSVLASFDPNLVTPDSPRIFGEPMFVLLNLAVGGDWPGPPDASTPFPATMLVDRVQFVPLD